MKIEKISDAILNKIREKIGNDFKFYKGFLPEQKYRERINNPFLTEKRVPFILLRAERIKHTLEQKKVFFTLSIVTEEPSIENGYSKILEITMKIMELLENHHFSDKEYRIALEDEISAYMDGDYTGGDYWGYSINFSANLPSAKKGSIIEDLNL